MWSAHKPHLDVNFHWLTSSRRAGPCWTCSAAQHCSNVLSFLALCSRSSLPLPVAFSATAFFRNGEAFHLPGSATCSLRTTVKPFFPHHLLSHLQALYLNSKSQFRKRPSRRADPVISSLSYPIAHLIATILVSQWATSTGLGGPMRRTPRSDV